MINGLGGSMRAGLWRGHILVLAAIAAPAQSLAQTPAARALPVSAGVQQVSGEEFLLARLKEERRRNDDRITALLTQLDANKALLLSATKAVSEAQKVSQNTLIAVTLALGLELSKAGRPADVQTLLSSIEGNAKRILELEDQVRRLQAGADPALAAQLAKASGAIEAGDLEEAKAILREARVAARAAREGAQLREGEVIGAEARVAGLKADWLNAAALYAEAAEIAPESARQARWGYRNAQAYSLSRRGELFLEPEPLQEAVQIYQDIALPLAPREIAPSDWRMTQSNLGDALRIQGERGVPGALAGAEAALEAALSVTSQNESPEEWAILQVNLGLVYAAQGELDKPGALEDAVRALSASLPALRRTPYLWAVAQMNLGNAYVRLYQRGDPESLRPGISAFEEALTELHPHNKVEWAATQIGLGNLLYNQAKEEKDPRALDRAVQAFELALAVLSSKSDPGPWAFAQIGLANALRDLGSYFVPGAFERAATAYEAGLSVLTSKIISPRKWAAIQTLFGLTLLQLGDANALARAETALNAALTIRTPETDLAGWAETTSFLALAYRAAVAQGDPAQLPAAKQAARLALEGFEQVGDAANAAQARKLIADLDRLKPQ